MSIAIIIPTYNEKENIINLVIELSKITEKSQIVIVDDSKKDDISKKLKI